MRAILLAIGLALLAAPASAFDDPKALVTAMIDEGPGAGFRWMLHTADAHGLYTRHGFGPPDEMYLERPSRR